MLVFRLRPIFNSFNFFWIWFNTFLRNDVSQKFNFLFEEVTLLGLKRQVVILNSQKDFLNVSKMLFRCLAENQNIIYVDEDKFIQLLFEDLIHDTLKYRRGIRQTHGHNTKLKMT